MLYGAHLPLIGFGDTTFSLEGLLAYARTAEDTGYTTLCMNDHLLFSKPWLDGPVALAAVLSQTKRMKLATTVALPVIRGPVALAKTLAAIDLLSSGRLIIAVGPGSSLRDYDAVGLPFEERWKRLDEGVAVMRRLLRRDGPHFRGWYYSSEGLSLEPYPAQTGGPPIWIGSWGSEAGLKRTARLADGWLASAYNTTTEIFSSAWKRLQGLLPDFGKDPKKFPNALSTMFFYVTESKSVAERVLKQVIAPAINRPIEELRQRLMVGPAEECAEKLTAFKQSGLQSVYLWPVKDELKQLEVFQKQVAPLV